MEWTNVQESSSHHSLMGSKTPQYGVENTQWTFEENKIFENGLTEFDQTSISFYQNVASKIPWKSIEEVKKHYESLVEDVAMIECGRVPTPEYHDHTFEEGDETQRDHGTDLKNDERESSSLRARRTYVNHQRQKAVPWTEAEHQLFLMGLNRYGKGDWKSISRYYVVTKTPTQVASHAQKFFRRRNNSTPADKRRPSIHDIQTVNSTSISMPHRNPPNTENPVPISLPHSDSPMNNHNYKVNEMTDSAYSIATTTINQEPSGPSAPFSGNQTWG